MRTTLRLPQGSPKYDHVVCVGNHVAEYYRGQEVVWTPAHGTWRDSRKCEIVWIDLARQTLKLREIK
jgi:hypothetical protein